MDSYDFLTTFKNILLSEKNANSSSKVVLGDMNINIVGTHSVDNDYLDIMLSICRFKSHNNVYTRTPLNSRHSCSDHIFVKNNKLIENFEAGVIQTTITDHYFTILAIPLIKQNNFKSQYNLESINFDKVVNNSKTELWIIYIKQGC